ncbi:NAD(+) diphosphatase [bacterium AH-315-J19]|nr:NAD(+) diphosphatase [Robiginitomaculum sp.]MBN4058536.1 NAD(+) diphosphatase [bacterium AH-315-J19]
MTSTTPMAFTGAPLDLAENQRDAASLTVFSKADNARAFVMFHGRFLVKNGDLVMVHPLQIKGSHLYDPGPLFLGLDGKTPMFAFSFAKEEEALKLVKGAELDHLRNLSFLMDGRQLALAGRAKSLFDWHRSHRFCSNCGKESKPQAGGVTRQCPTCETDHFPRVNPVVIMLVLDGDNCLMGRGPEWPDGAFSALAGFVSPGESLSEACIREVKEEVNIDVENPEFKFSQPWPYPGQLMMGMVCQAKNTKITLDTKELADAKWFSKDEVRSVFEGTNAQKGTPFICPPPFTIAHQLIKAWLAE